MSNYKRVDLEEDKEGWSFVDEDSDEYHATNYCNTTEIGINGDARITIISEDIPMLIKVLQAAYMDYKESV